MLRRVQPGEEGPIGAFVADFGDHLRPRLDDAYLQALLAKAEGHLRQTADEIEELGVSTREAERAAAAAYGRPRFEAPPSRLAASLGLAARTGRRRPTIA